MKRQFLQRWSVILLLGARLVLGELAQAMPHDHHAVSANGVAVAAEQPCHDEHAAEPAAGASVAASDAHDTDCCKSSGSCQCVCAHVCAIAMPSLSTIGNTEEVRIVAPDVGPTEHRLSGLFRPPA